MPFTHAKYPIKIIVGIKFQFVSQGSNFFRHLFKTFEMRNDKNSINVRGG